MRTFSLLRKDHLITNSLWLMLNSAALTGLGFFFWAINARLYSAEQVGIASALLSSAELVAVFSLLGFDIALVRYLPNQRDKRTMMGSALFLCLFVAIIASLGFVLLIKLLLPGLSFLQNGIWTLLFILFVVSNVAFILVEAISIALRRSSFVFIKNVVFSTLKIVLGFVLVALGTLGIFGSWLISLFVSTIVAFSLLSFRPRFHIDKNTIARMLKFSFVNYLARFFALSPIFILPLMITSMVSAEMAAYFYIDWMIATILFMIPYSVSQSLFAEGSKSKRGLQKKMRKALLLSYALLIVAVVIVVALAPYLLLVFGEEYSKNATLLLRILVISSLFYAINTIYIAIKNVEHQPKKVLSLNLFVGASVLAFSYVTLEKGILWIGIAWLAVQAVSACRNAWILVREHA